MKRFLDLINLSHRVVLVTQICNSIILQFSWDAYTTDENGCLQNDLELCSNRLSNPEIYKDISSSSASATSASFSRRADSNHVENAAQQRITQPKNDSNHNTQDIIPTVSNCITAKEVPKIANQNSSSSGAKAVQSSNLGMKISFKLYKKDSTF